MIIILKPLFEVFTGDVAVMDNVICNYLIMLIVGEIAFRGAWRFVGDLYHLGLIEGKSSGSLIHWVVRFIFYVVTAYIIRGGIWLYGFFILMPHWIWWLLVAIAVTSTIVAIYINLNSQKSMAN